MNRQYLRYLVISVVTVAASAVLVQSVILSLVTRNPESIAGAALVVGYLTALTVSGTVAILAARRVAGGFIDPRLGQIAGLMAGLWVGIGAIVGQILAALLLSVQAPGAAARPGLVLVFGLVLLVVSVIAGMLTGRETAQPPEAEEEA